MINWMTFFLSGCLILSTTFNPLSHVQATDTPVIGILAQEFAHGSAVLQKKYYPNYTSYIAASYVKQVEASGARVVPILINQSREYYASILSHINGVVLPGGAAPFDQPNGYAEAARHIVNIVEKLNDQGTVMPILAVCLGFELILEISNNNVSFRRRCKVVHVNLTLDFIQSRKKSSLFKHVPFKFILKLANKNVTHNNHIYCVEMRDMVSLNLTDKWNVLTVSQHDEWKFVSTVEHKTYPFVGIQFHPEKNAFEWSEKQHHIHTPDAIVTARIFNDWLINKARLNNHAFSTKSDLYRNLIQTHKLFVAYPAEIGFEQIYLFNS